MQSSNKENEQPMLSAMMISTGANSNLEMAHHHYTAMHDGNHGFQPPASAKIPHIAATGNIHAPRQSFTKRSFGRDLMNIQQPSHQAGSNGESQGKAHLFNMQNKVGQHSFLNFEI